MQQIDVPADAIVTIVEPVLTTFYLNIVLLNKDEVISKIVHDKVGPGPLGFGIGAKLSTSLAKRAMKDEKVASKLAEQLVDVVPEQIKQMGINLSLTKRYVGGPLVVLKAQIMDTDAVQLITSAKGAESGQKMKELQDALEFLELSEAKQQMTSKMMTQSREKLMEKLVVMLPDKLAEAAGAKVEMNALGEADEAEWFFSFLETHREAHR